MQQKLKIPKPKVFLCIIIILLPFLVFVAITTVKAQSSTDISVQTAYDMINNNTYYPNLIILDVRDQTGYNASHLHNAINIHYDQIDAKISELMPYNETEIIVYCSTGVGSAIASQNLADNHNFTKIYNMLGGLEAWIDEGYPIWPFNGISVQKAFEMINNYTQYPNLLILDVREQDEYDESHLYNATLIPLGQIDSRISELMPYNDTEIIVYCRTGVRGAVASQNLGGNYNFTKVFNMLGAINAWIAAGYPVWTSNNVVPSIEFFFIPFIWILFGAVAVLVLYFKKRRYK